MEFEKIKVYVKVNENNEIIEINSSIFLADTTDYIEIDSGYGDKYAHAQGNYLDKPLTDEQGRYNYKLVDGVVVEIAEEDKPTIEPQTIEKSVWDELDEAYQEGVDSV